ncbi:hypothetical protein IFM89_038080 [Coptis chinensis]|uniref:Disease resistance R13L4/SHOC-2-like LRR domain-containing protein n=1 Tax=Coptis chinensis TaxID=261450 RepID=A0A835M646_9MAGN|nr:hypothetical protein IFM89_038080 [Coptis chinensis]
MAKSSKSVPLALFNQLTCLRTLDLSCELFLSGSALKVLPSEVNKLLHLRYLDLSNTRLKELPETMRSLVNVQTLKLNCCYNLCRLPEGIGELSNLRHLEVERTSSLIYYPRGIERLSQLRTLSKFVVGDGSKGSVIGGLGNFNFLKGKIAITGLRHVKTVNEAKLAELHKKKNISKLELNFGEEEWEEDEHISSEDDIRRMEGVLENMELHKSLEGLVIQNYDGFTLPPPWMLSAKESVLSNIIRLELYSAVKHLGADLLRDGNGDSTYSSSSSSIVLFPKLKKLCLSNLPEWEEEEHDVPTTTSDNTNIMPRLHYLQIIQCPKLKVVPVYLFPPLLETLELGCHVGILSKSLMPLTHDNNNLKTLHIFSFPHCSLPQGLNQLTSLQNLIFISCEFLDFKPEELKPLTMLRKLETWRFPIIKRELSREEDWSILTHIPSIVIDGKDIKSRN